MDPEKIIEGVANFAESVLDAVGNAADSAKDTTKEAYQNFQDLNNSETQNQTYEKLKNQQENREGVRFFSNPDNGTKGVEYRYKFK